MQIKRGKTNPDPVESHYDAKGIELIFVGNNQQKDGAFIVADEKLKAELGKGVSEEEFVDKLCKTKLQGSKEIFGITFSPRNVAVLSDMEQFSELVTNNRKVRKRLVEKHYADIVKRICN